MVKEFEMTNLDLMTYFLSIEMKQNYEESFIFQTKYVNEILKKFHMEYCHIIDTIMEVGCKLNKEGEGKEVKLTCYKSLLGSLRYLTCIRLDILYGLGLISHYMENLKWSHL